MRLMRQVSEDEKEVKEARYTMDPWAGCCHCCTWAHPKQLRNGALQTMILDIWDGCLPFLWGTWLNFFDLFGSNKHCYNIEMLWSQLPHGDRSMLRPPGTPRSQSKSSPLSAHLTRCDSGRRTHHYRFGLSIYTNHYRTVWMKWLGWSKSGHWYGGCTSAKN